MSLLNKPEVDAINYPGKNMKAGTCLSEFLFYNIKYPVNPENITILLIESTLYT